MLYSQRKTKRNDGFLHEAIGYIKPRLCPPQAQPVSTSAAHFSVRNSLPYVQKDFFFLLDHCPGVGDRVQIALDLFANTRSSQTSLDKTVACGSCDTLPWPSWDIAQWKAEGVQWVLLVPLQLPMRAILVTMFN